MKTRIIGTIGAIIMMLLILGGIPTNAADKPIELKLATHWPAMHDMNNAMIDFARLIGLESGGRIRVTYYPAGMLANTGEKYLKVRTGVTDMTNIHLHLHPAEFPLVQLSTLPFLWADGMEATWVLNQMNDVWAKELEAKNIKLLYMIGDPNFQFLLRDKKVKKPSDFKGLRIRCGGFADEALKIWGAIPVSLKHSDMYEAMHRGVVDSIVFPVGAGKAFKLEEVIKYVYKCEFFSYHLHLAMNLDTWKRLPKDLQEAVTRASRKAEQVSGFHYENQDALSFAHYKAGKIEIYEPTEAELKELKTSTAGLKDKMVADLEKNGLPGKKTMARMEDLIEKYRSMGNIDKLKLTY